MKKCLLLLLVFALLMTGCGGAEALPESAENTPVTFGNAVLSDTPETAEAVEALQGSTEETVVGYIWRLQDDGLDYALSIPLFLQSDGSGGFWVLNSGEDADGVRLSALHFDENGMLLSETAIPYTYTEDTACCNVAAFSGNAVFYDYGMCLQRGGGDTASQWEYHIRACDLDGDVLFSLPLTELTGGEDTYITAIAAKDDYCLLSTEKQVFAISTDGQLLWQVSTEESIDTMVMDAAGKVYIKTEFDDPKLLPLDTDSHTLGDSVYTMDAFESPWPGVLGYDLLLCSNSSNSPKLYGLDLETGEKTPLWDCGAMGMAAVDHMVETGNGALMVNYVSLMSGWAMGQLVQEPVYEGQQVISLTLGVCGALSATADAAVTMFNSMYPEYYLQVAAYEDAETMNLAVLSGEGPDIICLSGLSEEDYVRNGQLLNLYDYLSGDETLSKADLVPEYLAEYEISGGLYRLSPVFSYGYLGVDAEYVSGDADTFQEYLAAARAGAEEKPVWDMPAESAIQVMLGYSMTNFVDFDAGTCDFENAEFCALLELCSMGRVLTEEEYIAGAMFLPGSTGVWNEYLGERGFPASGVLVTEAMDTFGIYAGSAHPEAAWNFLSMLLTEDIQRAYADMTGSCPVLNELYEQLTPEAVKTCIKKAQGHSVFSSPIHEIVTEEAAEYFGGEISAETAAEHIQNRVMIYLGENR